MVNSSTCATATRRPSGCLGLPVVDITCLRMVRRTARRGNRGSRTGGQRLSAKGMVDELSQISGQERVYGGRGGDSTHGGVKASWSLMQIDGPGCRITSLEVTRDRKFRLRLLVFSISKHCRIHTLTSAR